MKTISIDKDIINILPVFKTLKDTVYSLTKVKSHDVNKHKFISVGETFTGKIKIVGDGYMYCLVLGSYPFGGMHTSPIVDAGRNGDEVKITTRNSIYILKEVV